MALAVGSAVLFAPAGSLAASYVNTVKGHSPSAYYRLGEASGTLVAKDTSGRGRDGTYVTGTLGVPGGTTDGDTAVAAPTMVASFTGDDQSIEFWARSPTEPASGPKVYLSHGTDVNGVPTAGWVLELSRADEKFHLSYVDSVGQLQNVALGCQPPDGTFHHYVITIGYAFKCYRDGVLQSSSSATPGETSFVRVSARTGQFAIKAPATVDEVAIYTTEIPAEDVLAHFNAGLQPYSVAAPRLGGNLFEGADLDATTGTWRGAELVFTYEWKRCTDTTTSSCTSIPDATGARYTLTADDVGRRIAVVVQAANSHGVASAWSAITGVIEPPLQPELADGQQAVSLDWERPTNPGPSSDLQGAYVNYSAKSDSDLLGSYSEGEGGDRDAAGVEAASRGRLFECYIKAYYPQKSGASFTLRVTAVTKNRCNGAVAYQSITSCLQKLTDVGWKNYDCRANSKNGSGVIYVNLDSGSPCRTGHWRQSYFGSVRGPTGKNYYQAGDTPSKVIYC